MAQGWISGSWACRSSSDDAIQVHPHGAALDGRTPIAARHTSHLNTFHPARATRRRPTRSCPTSLIIAPTGLPGKTTFLRPAGRRLFRVAGSGLGGGHSSGAGLPGWITLATGVSTVLASDLDLAFGAEQQGCRDQVGLSPLPAHHFAGTMRPLCIVPLLSNW